MKPYETLIGLVQRYSPSGEEAAAVHFLVERMQALGFTRAFRDKVGNAVGIMGTGARQIVLLGHIDTVPGEIPVRVEGGVLYGRGSVDAKGPLAAFVDAVAQVGAVEGWQLVVIGAVDEERDSIGARHVVNQYQPVYAIIGEPNGWERIALGYKGSAWAEVTIVRPQRHSASGEQTAAEAAVTFWQAVQALAADFNAGKQGAFDKILPTLRTIAAEESAFEQTARLRLGARLPVEVSPEQWYAHLQQLLTVHLGDGCQLRETGSPVPAWVCEKNSGLVRTFLSGIRKEGGRPRFVYKTGTADLNIVAPQWGCPAVVYGPGDSVLDHTPDEHIALEAYIQARQVLVHVLRSLVQG